MLNISAKPCILRLSLDNQWQLSWMAIVYNFVYWYLWMGKRLLVFYLFYHLLEMISSLMVRIEDDLSVTIGNTVNLSAPKFLLCWLMTSDYDNGYFFHLLVT